MCDEIRAAKLAGPLVACGAGGAGGDAAWAVYEVFFFAPATTSARTNDLVAITFNKSFPAHDAVLLLMRIVSDFFAIRGAGSRILLIAFGLIHDGPYCSTL